MTALAIFVLCNSHRARDKLFRLIGRRDGYYVADLSSRLHHRGIYAVTQSELDQARSIKGIRKLRDSSKLAKCWG